MADWLDVARLNRKTASLLVDRRDDATTARSAVSRSYYAVYSKITHELLASGLSEYTEKGPPHNGMRKLIVQKFVGLNQKERYALANLVGRLYTMRISADYRPHDETGQRDAREAHALMKTVFEAF